MTTYIERPRTCEAMQVTANYAGVVAEWAGGMVHPAGGVMYPVGDVWLTAPEGTYLVRTDGRLGHMDADVFEARWAADE